MPQPPVLAHPPDVADVGRLVRAAGPVDLVGQLGRSTTRNSACSSRCSSVSARCIVRHPPMAADVNNRPVGSAVALPSHPMSDTPAPTDPGRAVLRRRQDRRGHRRHPGDRADDRRRLRGRRGHVVIASRKADAVDATVAELSPLRCVLGAWPPTCPPRRGRGSFAEAVAADHEQVHVLVNNAGATWGAPAGRARHRLVGPGAQPQRAGRLPHHQVLPAPARGRSRTRPTVTGHQHRLHRRDPRPRARVLLVLGLQGRRPPAHPAPGQAARPDHHRQRGGTRPVRIQDDGRHPRGLR